HRIAQIIVRRSKRKPRNRSFLLRFRPDRVLHRLAFSQEIRYATKVRSFKRAALRLGPQPLHDHVQDVWLLKIDEVKNLRVFHAPFLQVRIRLCVLCYKGWCGNAEHIQGELLLIHQLWPWHADELNADAHKAHIVDVRGDVGSRPGETNPTAEGLRFGIDAALELWRQILVNNELAAHDTVRLGVSASLKATRFPESTHLRGKARYD